MWKVTLRSVWSHKLRLVFTGLAIVLGVAFMSGTLVLGDTINQVFDDLFADANEGVDVQVQGVEVFDAGFGGTANTRQELDISVVDTVRDVEGIERAEPYVQTTGFGAANRVLGPDGERLGSSNGPPTLLESWIPDEVLSPYRMEEGQPPTDDDQIALNVAAMESAELEVGDTVRVVTQLGDREYTISGTFLFGTAKSSGGAVSAEFTLAEAQRIAGLDGRTQTVLAAGDGSVPDAELAERVAEVLPDKAEAITGEEAAEQLASSVQEGFQFFQILLIVFALIAVVVGCFIIYNTFSILVAQRTREMALLRAIGAGREQVFVSVVLEAAVIGILATVLGLGAGVGLAVLVVGVLSSSGTDFPTTELVIGANTITTALVLGLGFTMALSVLPAIRATRVPPLAALREVAIDRSGASKARIVAGILLLLVAAFALSTAWTTDDDTTPIVGLGAFALIVGSIVVGPLMAGPSSRLLGAPLKRFGGITGQLATENAARSPKRTSATASALLIGVALIGFILIFAESARASVTDEVERGFTGDLVIQGESAGFGPSGFPPSVADTVASVDGVEAVSRVGFSQLQLTYPDGSTAIKFISALDPDNALSVFDPVMVERELSDLTVDGIVLDAELAESNDLAVGDMVAVTGPGGDEALLRVEALSDDFVIIGDGAVDFETYGTLVSEQQLFQVFALIEDDADLATVQADVESALADVPGLVVLDQEGFIGDLSSQITGLLNFVIALLLLSVVIAVIGIVNTLSLSIHERTRELGLLRAVGMSRGQVFRSVNLEAVIIAVLGTLVGLGIGLLVSWALVTSLDSFGLSSFVVPVPTLAVVVVISATLGVVASLYPAWRATRLQVLDAIATD